MSKYTDKVGKCLFWQLNLKIMKRWIRCNNSSLELNMDTKEIRQLGKEVNGWGGAQQNKQPLKDKKLHGCHIVEGMVQLLADGFVLQFLGVQLIYWVGQGGWREGAVEAGQRRWRKWQGGERWSIQTIVRTEENGKRTFKLPKYQQETNSLTLHLDSKG